MGLFTPVNFYRTRGALTPVLPNIDQTNLLRWYDANFDADSSTWTDQTSTQDASVTGNVTYDSTSSPYFYDFVGGAGTNGIGASASADLTNTTQTIQMWYRQSTSGNTNQKCLASQRSGTGTGGTRYSIHVHQNNQSIGIYNGAEFRPSNSNAGGTNFTIDTAQNTWYFIELMMNTFAADSTVVYQNNVLKGTLKVGLNNAAGNEPFGIGTPNYNSSAFDSEFFVGEIAMVLVYSGNTRPTGNWDATKSRFGY